MIMYYLHQDHSLDSLDLSIYCSLQTISNSDYQVSVIVCCYIQPIFVHDVRAVLCWRAGHAATALPKPEEVPSNQSCVSADTIFLIELFICLSAQCWVSLLGQGSPRLPVRPSVDDIRSLHRTGIGKLKCTCIKLYRSS